MRVAFMPWVQVVCNEPVLGCRFLPYAATDKTLPSSVHQVLGCYRGTAHKPIERATLIEVDGQLVSDFGKTERARAFQAGALVAAAALLRRELLPAPRYVNSDSFGVVIEPCGDSIAITTIRRGGSSSGCASGASPLEP